MLSLKAYRKIQCFGASVHYIHFNTIGMNSYTDQCEVKTGGAKLSEKCCSNIMGKAGKEDKSRYFKLKITGENAGLQCPRQNHYY